MNNKNNSDPDFAKSYFHLGGKPSLLGGTIDEHFIQIVRRYPDHEAIVGRPQGRRLNYRELDSEIGKLARGLIGIGFSRGDRIGVWSTNNVEWVLIQMATARIGSVLVNINPAYRPRELAYALERSEVQGLFLIPAFRSSDYAAMLQDLIPELQKMPAGNLKSAAFPLLRRVMIYDPANPMQTSRPSPGFTTWQEVLKAGSAVPPEALQEAAEALDRDDPINIQYTSGTTGFPKAVVLTHHNILNNAWFSAKAMHFEAEDRLCVSVPFYHCFGMVVSNLVCFSTGACLVIPCEHFEPGAVLEAVDAERCTAIHGVPTMFIAELEQADFERFDLSSLRTGVMAGAPCPPELMRRVIEKMGCKEILIGYGQTEASPITHLTSRDDTLEHRIETVGTNLPHQEVKVISTDTGRTVPLGRVGEICFRGYHIMRGYYGDTKATREAIDDSGWLHSGDLGIMEPRGYLRVTGRLKEMIIRGGENIYPREIEDFLFTHPKIAEVAVFGIPDERYGEQVAAWIQLHEGEVLTKVDVMEFCRGEIAHFKIPARIRFVQEFPMTVTGKLQKFRMREMELTSEAEDI